MRSRLIAVGISAAAIAVLFMARGWLGSKPAPGVATVTPTKGSPPVGRGVTQAQVQADILRKGLTPERAALLFSIVVGPLPGVTVPEGSRDASEFDGTMAVEYLYREWSALTEDQRRAARQLIEGPATAPRRARRSSERPMVVPAAFFVPPPSETPAYDFTKLAGNADAALALFLGGVPPIPTYLVTVRYDAPTGSEKAHTFSWYRDDDATSDWRTWLDGCHITVWNQQFESLTETDAESIMTHEMFHCYQQRQAGNPAASVSVPKWIIEGEATWVMSAVVPAATGILVNKWSPYVLNPSNEYYHRDYDAVGVFAHLSDIGGNQIVWAKLLPMVIVGVGNKSADAFDLLIKGNELNYYTSWGSSYFDAGPSHAPWNMSGPGSPPTPGPPPTPVTVDAGVQTALPPLNADQAGLFTASGGADVVVVSLFAGYGRLHDQSFVVDTALDASGPLALCLKDGGCTCPDGTPGASLFTQRATPPLSIGLDGGDMKSEVTLSGQSLDDFCKNKKPDKKQPAPPEAGGGGGGGGGDDPNKPPDGPPSIDGGSMGDPHLTTFDGLRYDFQVVGEYTLVRSTKDDFLVQIRQVPVLGSKMASLNQSVATRLGDDRVTISLENNAEVLRVNGKATSGPLPVLKGGTIARATTMYGVAYQLTWPDGSVVRTEQLGRFGLNVKVQPAVSRRGTLAGLLGDADGSAANDLVGQNSAGLGSQPAANDVTHSLADAWRVAAATSLFDYQPGQSTATFTDPSFPSADLDAAAIPNRAAAETACRNEGIVDAHLLDACVLDLAETNESLFGSAYGHAQRVMTARAASARSVVSTAAVAEKLPVLLMSGTIADKTQHPEFHFTGRAGDVIWLNPPDCSDKEGHIFMLLAGPDGKQLRGGPGCEFGRFALPAGGQYTFRANYGASEPASYHVPIRFVRHDRRKAIAYDTAVSGAIEDKVAHDVYTFSAKAGDVLQLSGEGCELPGFTGIVDPQGFDLLGPGCRAGTGAKLNQTGTWELVINYTNSATGPYRFVLQNVGPVGK